MNKQHSKGKHQIHVQILNAPFWWRTQEMGMQRIVIEGRGRDRDTFPLPTLVALYTRLPSQSPPSQSIRGDWWWFYDLYGNVDAPQDNVWIGNPFRKLKLRFPPDSHVYSHCMSRIERVEWWCCCCFYFTWVNASRMWQSGSPATDLLASQISRFWLETNTKTRRAIHYSGVPAESAVHVVQVFYSFPNNHSGLSSIQTAGSGRNSVGNGWIHGKLYFIRDLPFHADVAPGLEYV